MRLTHSAPRSTALRSLLTVAALATLAPSITHAQSDAFDWSGAVAQGATVHVFTFAGTVTVRQASGSEARIRGTSRNARSADEIRFVQSQTGNGVLVCALYDDAECTESGIRREGRRSDRNGRAEAEFVIQVPRGVSVRVGSGSGEVTVEGVTGNVNAASGSGTVRVGAGAAEVRAASGSGIVTVDGALGRVQASTGSGDVRITTGVLSTTTEDTELRRVRDSAVARPFSLRIVGLGDVRITSADPSTPRITLEAIRDPDRVQDMLRRLVEQRVKQQGVREIDIM